MPTVYPPVAQMLFGLNAVLGGGTVLLRALLLLVEAGGLAAIYAVLRTSRPALDDGLIRRAFGVYALCPLVFVEIAWSGHVDVLAWMPLVVALLIFARAPGPKGAAWAGALFGVSVAAKFLGLLVLPLVLLARRRTGERSWARTVGRRAVFVVVACLVIGAAYLPYRHAGTSLFSGFGTYASSWQGNDGPFRAVASLSEATLKAWAPVDSSPRIERTDSELIFRFPQHDETFEKLGWTREWRGRTVPATSFTADQLARAVAKAMAALCVGLALLWALLVRRSLAAGALVVLLALFFVAPIVHPWYVAWLVPFAALVRSRAALTFSFTVLAAYLAWLSARQGGPWQVPTWALVVEYGAVALVVVWELASDSDQQVPPTAVAPTEIR